MADGKISADPSAGALDGTEIVPIVQSSANKKVLLSALKTFILNGLQLAWGSITGTPTTLSGYGITDAASSSALSSEASTRSSVDTTLQTNITNEASTRASADTTLQTNITTNSTAISTHTAATTSVHGIADTAKLQSYGRTTFSNADATISAGTHYLAQIGTLSAARTVTLPAASAVPAGFELIVADESGTVTATNTIIITRAGSDTVNGGTSTTLNTAYGRTTLISDGTSKWTLATSTTTVNQSANQVYAGPSSGAAAVPTFRALVSADLPLLITGDKGAVIDDLWNNSASAQNGIFGYTDSNSGSGSTPISVTVPDGSAFGCVQILTGSTSTGRSGILTTSTSMRFGAIPLSVTWRFLMPSLLDGTENGAIYIGFIDSLTAAPVDGAYIYWDNTQTNFRYRTRTNSTETDIDSGLAPVANTWYAVTVSVNAAGSSVAFSVEVNNSRATALTNANAGTITTNIPTAGGRETAMGASIIKSAGTTNRAVTLDYLRLGWG